MRVLASSALFTPDAHIKVIVLQPATEGGCRQLNNRFSFLAPDDQV